MNTLIKALKVPTKLTKVQLNAVRSAMAEAYNSYEKGLSKRALYKTNNTQTGQDLVQSTFLKTLLYLQKGGKIDTMRSFLNHVLNDLIIDEYRKNKTVSLDVLQDKGFEISVDDYVRHVNTLDGKDIALLIPQLPLKYMAIIQMRYLKDMSLKEISLITGQTPNTVAVQVHRGLERLKVLYDQSHT